MFKITAGRGFQMTFANGFTMSVQFGPGNYCENYGEYDWTNLAQQERDAGLKGSANAEIAAWGGPDNAWLRLSPNDDVKGYVTPDEVIRYMAVISQLPPDYVSPIDEGGSYRALPSP
jgi:hypothetical protein